MSKGRYKYTVVVGNIGTVVCTHHLDEAKQSYIEYVNQSEFGGGRAAGEDVTLFEDGEPIMEHTGALTLEDMEDA